jgi:RHS repeat-associated protein
MGAWGKGFGGVRTATGALPTTRFPGQWFQSESGLHQNWMRDYDPTTGRYIQADPLGLVDGASVYGYVGQNPGRFIDPRGEEAAALGTAIVRGVTLFGGTAAATMGAGIAGFLGILLYPSTLGDGTIPETQDAAGDEPQQCAADDGGCSPATSPFWRSLSPYRGKTKTAMFQGKEKRFYEWDYTHCNVEVYDRRGKHIGVADPISGTMIGAAVPGRRIAL